jgi:hypothetical protein
LITGRLARRKLHDSVKIHLGGAGSILVIVSLLFLPWYSLTHSSTRGPSSPSSTWICGTNDYSCTGFETFPVLRWLLIAGALSPLILAWIIVRGHKLSWAPGEVTMVVGFTMMTLILQRDHRPAGRHLRNRPRLRWPARAPGIDRDRGHGLPPLAGRPEAVTQGPRHRLIR